MRSRADIPKRPRLRIQETSADCGLVCVQMLCESWRLKVDIDALRARYSASRGGMNFLDLSRVLNALGFEVRAVSMEARQLLAVDGFAIAHWNRCHAVLVHGAKGRTHVFDPGRGEEALTPDQVEQHFSGTCLLVSRQALGDATEDRRLGQLIAPYLPYASARLVLLALAGSLLVFHWFRVLMAADRAMSLEGVLPLAGTVLAIALMTMARDRWADALEQTMSRRKGHLFYPQLVAGHNLRDAAVAGRLLSSFSDELQIVRIKPRIVPLALGETIACLLLLASLCALMWQVGLIVAAIAGLCIYFWQARWRHTQNQRLIARSVRRDFFLLSEQLIDFARDSSMAAQPQLRRKWDKQFAAMVAADSKARHAEQGHDRWIAALPFVVPIAALVSAHGLRSEAWGATVSVALLSAIFSTRLAGLFRSLDALSQHVPTPLPTPTMPAATSSYEEVDQAAPTGDLGTLLIARDIVHSYDASTILLSGVNLSCREGDMIALRGASGSGKTTLLSIISRDIVPRQGSIVASGRIGRASMDSKIFSASMLDNITLFEPEPDEPRLNRVLDACMLREVLAGLPMDVHTYMGVDGLLFSLGQRQRVLLARALYQEPDTLLIDECLTAVQSATCADILSQLSSLTRCVVVCAHNFPDLGHFNRFLLLSDRGLEECTAMDFCDASR